MDAPSSPRVCVECEDTEAALRCDDCRDDYCELCFQAQHRAGSRRAHHVTPLTSPSVPSATALPSPPPSLVPVPFAATVVSVDTPAPTRLVAEVEDDHLEVETSKTEESGANEARKNGEEEGSDGEEEEGEDAEMLPAVGVDGESPLVRDAAYVPLRLTEDERALFNLLDASLNVSEYTDKVDVLSYRSPVKRVIQELSEVFSTLSGMMVATDFRKGKRLVHNSKFEENAAFFREVFEIGRRYKIMNPERMRNNYGKMIYMLQDANMREIQNYMGFSCVRPIRTVKSFLTKRHSLDLLRDHRCLTAVAVVSDTLEGSREAKQRAIDELVRDYASASLSADDIRLVLASIDDSQSYLVANRTPITRMIEYLEQFFSPDKPESAAFSLEIRAGKNGARLSHSHGSQYEYVLQSLLLWRNMTSAMLRLWWAVEDDLLLGSSYRLRDTGQGLNRVQYAPKTSARAHGILSRTQQMRPRWVGSSVIHLGDHNVPNALMFIDKYTQTSRILSPIVNTLDEIVAMATHRDTKALIADFGGATELQKLILCDFFKHGFDGSGADNFFDAGSCIDGRLTSAWNWCSKIEKKPFYHAFLMAGFVGFDGQFER